MRTQKEIINKIEELISDGSDWMYIIQNDLVSFLDFEFAKKYLEEDALEDTWESTKLLNTVDSIKSVMREYLDFAFKKAGTQRGLSASRSMDHYYAWIWLLNEEDHFGDVRQYTDYGIPHLNKIKTYLEIE